MYGEGATMGQIPSAVSRTLLAFHVEGFDCQLAASAVSSSPGGRVRRGGNNGGTRRAGGLSQSKEDSQWKPHVRHRGASGALRMQTSTRRGRRGRDVNQRNRLYESDKSE